MPGRRRPRQSEPSHLSQHADRAFGGALDGASTLPQPVGQEDPTQRGGRSPKLFFHQEQYSASGGAQQVFLTHLPVLNSEHVYLLPGGAASEGMYHRQGLGWERDPGTRDLRILSAMDSRSGDLIVVEYAYYETFGGGTAFREVDLPYAFSQDDDSSVPFYLPFNFHGFGQQYPIYIASNGIVKLRDDNGTSTNYYSTALWEHGYILAPYWTDHDTRTYGAPAGTTRYGVVQIDGKSALVVIWDKVAIYNGRTTSEMDGRRCRFQLVLFPDGTVEFNYDSIQTDCGSASSNDYFYFIDLDVLELSTNTYPGGPDYAGGRSVGYSTDDWMGPRVGYFLPGHLWMLPASGRRSIASGPGWPLMTPEDPVYGSGYPRQGIFGLTDDGAEALTSTSNCGVPGRLKFNLGARGPGIRKPSFNTYSPASATWDGSSTTIIWNNLPSSLGLVVDMTGTSQNAISPNYYYATLFYTYNNVVDYGSGTAPFLYDDSTYPPPSYMSTFPVAAGSKITSYPFYVDPHWQVGGRLKISIPFHVTSPVLRVLETIQYVY